MGFIADGVRNTRFAVKEATSNARFAASKASGAVSGTIAGWGIDATFYESVEDYLSLEKKEDAFSKKNLKALVKLTKILNIYDAKYASSLVKTYQGRPDKLNQKITDILNTYSTYITAFKDNITVTIKQAEQIEEQFELLLAKFFVILQQYLSYVLKQSEKHKFALPPKVEQKINENIKKQLKKAEKTVQKIRKMSERTYLLLRKSRMRHLIKVGTFTSLFHSMDEKRLHQKIEILISTINEMKAEIRAGKIRQDFFSLVELALEHYQEVEKIAPLIMHYQEKLVKTAESCISSVKIHFSQMKVIFQNEKNSTIFNSIDQILNQEITITAQSISDKIKEDNKNETALHNMESNLKGTVHTIQVNSNRMLKDAEKIAINDIKEDAA